MKELEEILKSEDSLQSFFTRWSMKEAFLKALGTGLFVPLNTVNAEQNKITWDGKEWFLHEIKIDQMYTSHLCTDIFLPKIILEEVNFFKGTRI